VKFLVDLRTDLLRFLDKDEELAVLDRELESRLTAWFDVGFLELQRITWHSPASLLEKLIQYEAVHEIRSWNDLRNRLDSDRRLYAFFHPRMPQEPLIFVEVALTKELSDNIQALLDEHAPVFDPMRADTAIFYSISNTQAGLRGVTFGNFLLKRVIDDLKRDFPQLKTFATLSPLPQFCAWLKRAPEALDGLGLTSRSCNRASGRRTRRRRAACATHSRPLPPATSTPSARTAAPSIRWRASTSATAPASSASISWRMPRPRASSSPAA
jgi:malonyl-CoA decarboxylase